MKYLIDGMDKQVSSLASQYKRLRAEDTYKVYDSKVFSNSAYEGMDLLSLTGAITRNDGSIYYEAIDEDTRRFTIATDFDAALAECDCYVVFNSIPYIIGNAASTEEAELGIDAIIERLTAARNAGKKIYLGNAFDDNYIDVIDNYENCINEWITEDNLSEVEEYSASTFEFDTYRVTTKITMIVGTNSCAGKFSCCLDAKEYYESKGEKVCLLMTEETYPFIDNSDGTIYSFCRNFSKMTTDQDFQYLQGLVCKIMSDQRPDRIIIGTQAGVGINGLVGASQATTIGKKMKGVWDILIERSFGLDSVIIAANWDRTDELRRVVQYYMIQGCGIDAIYLSPISFNIYAEGHVPDKIQIDDDLYYYPSERSTIETFYNVCNCAALEYPNIRISCHYGDALDEVNAFKNADNFKEMAISTMVVNNLRFGMDMMRFCPDLSEYSINNIIGDELESGEITEEQFQTYSQMMQREILSMETVNNTSNAN